jgi:hypothetical protein
MNDSHLQNYHFYLDWKFKKEKVQKDKELKKKLQKYVYLKMIQTWTVLIYLQPKVVYGENPPPLKKDIIQVQHKYTPGSGELEHGFVDKTQE